MASRIPIPQERIAAICRHYHVRKLALFGSVLGADFRPDSDVDMLVEFEPHHTPGFFGLARIEGNSLNSSAEPLICEHPKISADISGRMCWKRWKSNMNNDDAIRLMHMLDAAREAIGFFKGFEKHPLHENRMLLLATVKELKTVGEAATKITSKTRQLSPGIPWADIIGMRHCPVHAYFDIDTEVVWQTIASDIPPLITLLENLLGKSVQSIQTST